jgi:hypothetical protein
VWERRDDQTVTVTELQSRVADLEVQVNTLLGIMALLHPAATVLNRCGVGKEEQRAFYHLLDEMAMRVESGNSVSYADFEARVTDLVPSKRGDRQFFEYLIEALKLERPRSRPMLKYLAQAMTLFRN